MDTGNAASSMLVKRKAVEGPDSTEVVVDGAGEVPTPGPEIFKKLKSDLLVAQGKGALEAGSGHDELRVELEKLRSEYLKKELDWMCEMGDLTLELEKLRSSSKDHDLTASKLAGSQETFDAGNAAVTSLEADLLAVVGENIGVREQRDAAVSQLEISEKVVKEL